MSKQRSYVIVGNGIAGVTAAEVLREHDQESSITIIADDPFPAYYRPALKDFLGGRLPAEKLWTRTETFYKEHWIRFLSARVMNIDPARHRLLLHNGTPIHYDAVLLANGARSRTLECPGLNLAGVSTLRTIADYQEILHRLENVERVVVCGSGTLALESAETLRHRGYEITHLLRGKMLWSEVLDSLASEMVLQEEQRDGIEVRCGEEIAEILGKDGQVCGVVTTRGERISCEMVLIATSNTAVGQFYNATFLYGLDFVSVGMTRCPAAPGFQEIVAAPQARNYRKVILYNGVIVGMLLLGDRRQALTFKRAIDHHANLAPVAGQLFFEDFDLDAWLSAQGVPAPLLTLHPVLLWLHRIRAWRLYTRARAEQ